MPITKKQFSIAVVFNIILFFLLYHSTLSYLIHRWNRPDYNYCYLIPLIVIYLIWNKRELLFKKNYRIDATGFVFFFSGIFLFWLGELGGEYYTLFISLWFFLVGLFWLYYGFNSIKKIVFPLLFAITMFPFPDFLNNKFSFHLRLISSKIGVWILQIYGLPAYREGNIIDLGFVELQVVDACSGLRYLFPLVILSLIIAYLSKLSFLKRSFLFLSTFPLAIVTNSIRISLTGIIYKYWGAEFAEGFFHGFSGWLIFLFCFSILILEVWVLSKISFSKSVRSTHKAAVSKNSLSNKPSLRPQNNNSFYIQSCLASLIILITFVFSSNFEFRENIPIKKSFSSFPTSIGGWTGTTQKLDWDTMQALKLDDYVFMNYHNEHDPEINLYIAYYESQRKGNSIHSPETCIPGSGWIFTNKQKKAISFESSKQQLQNITISTAEIIKNDDKQLVFFWFPQRGRILTNAYQLKFFAFWDALTRQRTDGALVRLITPIKTGEDIQGAEKRLKSFLSDLMPVLDTFLPS